MLKVIFQVILAILVFRMLGSFVRLFRGGKERKKEFSGSAPRDTVDKPEYDKLTPYEIEDAEYEDIPRQK